MKFCSIFISLVLMICVPFPGYSDDRNTLSVTENEWTLVRPLAVSTDAIESPNGVSCYIGIAYEENSIRKAAVAMSKHCLDLVAIAALVLAEVTDDDNEEIKLAIKKIPTDPFDHFSHIYINGTEYDLFN